MGVTHGRYYVIMFGVFSLIAGLIFSFLPIKKNGMIVAVLLIFSAISIIPPVDAFTVSRVNQTNLLKSTLEENQMFENNVIVPNANISVEDKQIITRTVSYLESMHALDEINWLPDNIRYFDNFHKTFGFNETYDVNNPSDGFGPQSKYAYFNIDENVAINIEGHDFMTRMHVTSSHVDKKAISLEKEAKSYTIKQQRDKDDIIIHVLNESDDELIRYNTKEIFDAIFGSEIGNNSNDKGNKLTVEAATFSQETDRAKLTILVSSIDIYGSEANADFYVFLQIK